MKNLFYYVVALFASTLSLFAQTLVWDGSADAGFQNANGTWGVDDFWSLSNSDGTTPGAWTSAGSAWFGGGSTVATTASPAGDFSITVSGTQTVALLRQIMGLQENQWVKYC